MTAPLDPSLMLEGLHRVTKRKPATSKSPAKVTEYWYAWRGGPQILKVTGRGDDEVARLVSAEATAAILKGKELVTAPPADDVLLYGLITRFLIALEDMPGAPRTKRDLRKYLDLVRTDLHKVEIKALESPRARVKLVEWRDRYKKTPKAADERMNALSKVLDWAVDRGDLKANPVAGLEGLYTAPDRSEIIWEPHHLELLLKHASTLAFTQFVAVAVHTGMRLGDLRRLTWNAVGEDAIVFQTGKSNRKRTVVVPITDPLREILTSIGRGNSVTVLNSSRGRPWSEAGVESAIQTAKANALEEAKKRHGAAAKTGIEHLRIHDMRGTAATNFMVHGGLEDDDIATILGWKADTVKEIRRRYISGQAIGLAIVRRMRESQARQAAQSERKP